MLDLNRLVRTFVAQAVELQIKTCQDQDEDVIKAVNGGANAQARVEAWLKNYKVFQGYKNQERHDVASKVVEYAQRRDRNADLSQWPVLMKQYENLYNACAAATHPKRNGKPRDATSLASKALWSCYPSAVPVYDAHAQRAVWIIARLLEVTPVAGTSRYGAFAEIWLELYRRVEPLLEEADRRKYPYKVRAFDKILWIVGQPNYERAQSNASRRQTCGAEMRRKSTPLTPPIQSSIHAEPRDRAVGDRGA